jgi:KGK domain
MTDESTIIQCDDRDVLAFSGKRAFLVAGLCEGVNEALRGAKSIPYNRDFFVDGVECHLLQPGGDWLLGKAKIKISVEFHVAGEADREDCEQAALEQIGIECDQGITSENTNDNVSEQIESPLDEIRKLKLNT